MKQVRKHMFISIRYAAVLAVLLLGLVSIIGTGDSSSFDSSADTNIREGVFSASPVGRIYFETSSGESGYTELKEGSFTYMEGDEVEFFLGGPDGVLLGSADAREKVGPYDLYPDDHERSAWVAIILYALDTGSNVGTITLPESFEDCRDELMALNFDKLESYANLEDVLSALQSELGLSNEILSVNEAKKQMAESFGMIKEIQNGDIYGFTAGEVAAWRGIPYAAPPTGELRFAPPESLEESWSEPRDATAFGNECVQDDGSGCEDCLYLNVFAPREIAGEESLPVMVWIHGGAYIQGASSVPGYDMPALVKEDVIVVTINYRLNAFGFLPHPALEDPTGNFGLKDQVMALEWVQHNIEAFGGDPGNVTIFGESAGGHSVLSLLASSAEDGLFHKAIVQSGSYRPEQMDLTTGYYALGLPFADLPDADDGGTGDGPCSGYTEDGDIRGCLRDLSIEEIMEAQNAAPGWESFTPVYADVEKSLLPRSVKDALDDGRHIPDVPVMTGCNQHEGTLFAGLYLSDYNLMYTEEDYQNGVNDLLNPTGDDSEAEYVAEEAADHYLIVAEDEYGEENLYRNAYSMIYTDSTFTCNNLVQWNQLDDAGIETYAYWFTDEDAPINPSYEGLRYLDDDNLLSFGNWSLGASHSFEIQYIFGNVKDHDDVTSAQEDLSDQMVAYWAEFARNGTPGNDWERYDVTPNIRELHPDGPTDATVQEFIDTHQCEFWRNLEE